MKALLLGLFFGLSFAEAKVEAFSNLADSIRKKEIDGQVLLLNGIGIHRRFVFNIYRLSLYVPNPSTKPEELINSEEIKFAEMQFLCEQKENMNSKKLSPIRFEKIATRIARRLRLDRVSPDS